MVVLIKTMFYILKTQAFKYFLNCYYISGITFRLLSFFRKNCMNLVVSEILIWSTSYKLRTYDRDVSFAALRTSYYRPNFSYHTELHLLIAYNITLMQ